MFVRRGARVVTSLEDEVRGKEGLCLTVSPRNDREALSLVLSWFISDFLSCIRAFSSSRSILNAILSREKAGVWDGGKGSSMYGEC